MTEVHGCGGGLISNLWVARTHYTARVQQGPDREPHTQKPGQNGGCFEPKDPRSRKVRKNQ